MRDVKHLSPTGLATWAHSRDDFYLTYLAEERPPRIPQTKPMAIGSAFDAYAKSHLHGSIFGLGTDPKYDFNSLFEAQVESQNRDWAREHGKYVFEQYRQSGALGDLLIQLATAQGSPRFEFEVSAPIYGLYDGVTLTSVTLLGKPDVSFVNDQGAHIILDWKCNGYCSKTAPSPMPGYVKLRSAGKTSHGTHKNCVPVTVDGVTINSDANLETLNEDWAQQLSIYAWLCGEPVGGEFIVAVDQIVCNATRSPLPSIRVAEHRLRVGALYQQQVFQNACDLWEIIHSDHIFRDMTYDESRAKCEVLDGVARALVGDGSPADVWLAQICRGG